MFKKMKSQWMIGLLTVALVFSLFTPAMTTLAAASEEDALVLLMS